MATTFDKVHIKLRGNAVPIDRRFLDALSMIRFGGLYEECKTETNSLLVDLVGPGAKPPHPLDVHYIILKNLIPKNKAALLPE